MSEHIEVTAWYMPHRQPGELVYIDYDFDETAYVICHQFLQPGSTEFQLDLQHTREILQVKWIDDLRHRLEKISMPLYIPSQDGGAFGGTWFGLAVAAPCQTISASWQGNLSSYQENLQALWWHVAEAGNMHQQN